MEDLIRCESLLDKLSNLRYQSSASWEDVRGIIKEAQAIADKHDITIYNVDFGNWHNDTQKTMYQNSRKNFDIIVGRLKDTLLNLPTQVRLRSS